MKITRRSLRAATASCITAGFIATALVAAAPASAVTGDPSVGQDVRTTTPMNVVSYDVAVAEANGFRIITDADGKQHSVPVTAAAKSLVASSAAASAPAPGTVTPYDYASVEGNCGVSWIDISRGLSSITRIKTGYTVRLPTKARLWSVTLYGVAGIPNYPLNSPIGGPATWSASANVSYGSGGFGHVPPGSQVTLTDGAICVSGNPGTNF